jgi:hypothetical protein
MCCDRAGLSRGLEVWPAPSRASRASTASAQEPQARLRPGAPVSCTTYLDRETYDEVMALARKGNTSRNKIIGELVEWGLEAVRQGREGAT